jgi:hypothetical protein
MPYSAEDFQGINLPPSDDDSWLCNGEDELNAELHERQKEMEEYEALKKHTKSQKQNVSSSSSSQPSDFNLGEITESMQEFVRKMSSFEGAEVPSNRFSSRLICDLCSIPCLATFGIVMSAFRKHHYFIYNSKFLLRLVKIPKLTVP